MDLQHISASSIDTFDICNYSYKLRYVYGLKGFPNMGSEKGTVCHTVFEKYARCCMDDEYDAFDVDGCLEREFDKHFETVDLEYDREEEIEDCRKMIHKVLDKKNNVFQHKILGVEQTVDLVLKSDGELIYEGYSKDFGDENGKIDKTVDICDVFGRYVFRLYGFIDLIVEIDEDTIEVVDWKSGKSSKTFEALRKDTQAMLYALAVRYLYPTYDNYIVTFNYLRRKPITLSFSESEMISITNKLYSRWRKIKSCNDPKRTIRGHNAKWKCRFCAFNGGKEDCDIFFMLDSLGKPLDKAIQYAKMGRTLEDLA